MIEKLLNKITWTKGRQNSTYNKKLLFKSSKFDCWLLYYPKGSFIQEHTDQVSEWENHYRMNVILVKPKLGGKFISTNTIFNLGRIILFRPDIFPHRLTIVKKGYRLVLSIGWVTWK